MDPYRSPAQEQRAAAERARHDQHQRQGYACAGCGRLCGMSPGDPALLRDWPGPAPRVLCWLCRDSPPAELDVAASDA